MAKKKGRPLKIRSAGPDDPIYKEGLTIFTPWPARPKPPEEKDEPDEEPEE